MSARSSTPAAAGKRGSSVVLRSSDLHKVRIYVAGAASPLGRTITPGLKATFELPQYPGQQFRGDADHRPRTRWPPTRAACKSSCRPTMPTASLPRVPTVWVRLQLPVDPGMVPPARDRAPAPSTRGSRVAVLGGGQQGRAQERAARARLRRQRRGEGRPPRPPTK